MKITKTANNKKRVTLSKKEWQSIGKKAGWMETHTNTKYTKVAGIKEIKQKISNIFKLEDLNEFLLDLSSQRFEGMTLNQIAETLELEEEKSNKHQYSNNTKSITKKSSLKSSLMKFLLILISLGWGNLKAEEAVEKLNILSMGGIQNKQVKQNKDVKYTSDTHNKNLDNLVDNLDNTNRK